MRSSIEHFQASCVLISCAAWLYSLRVFPGFSVFTWHTLTAGSFCSKSAKTARSNVHFIFVLKAMSQIFFWFLNHFDKKSIFLPMKTKKLLCVLVLDLYCNWLQGCHLWTLGVNFSCC